MKMDYIVEVQKFNPYHGKDGRFATAGNHASFTYAPGKSRAHDLAIARETERQKTAEVLNRIGGQGATSVRDAIRAGAKWDAETQQRIANRINNSKIIRFDDYTDDRGNERYSFRMYGYDDKGSSVSSQPKKEWYSYDTALAIAAYSTLMKNTQYDEIEEV